MLLAALAIAVLVFRAWVVTVLWGWFLLPFYGLAVPSLPVAIGIMCVSEALWAGPPHDMEPEHEVLWAAAISVLTLVAGWLAHLFV